MASSSRDRAPACDCTRNSPRGIPARQEHQRRSTHWSRRGSRRYTSNTQRSRRAEPSVNVVFLAATRRGEPPIIGTGDPADFADPMPQSLVLTAIVISFGVTALLLALAYRSWLLTTDDEVADDLDDRLVGRRERRQGSRRCRHGGRPVSPLLALPIVLPLLGAALSILLGRVADGAAGDRPRRAVGDGADQRRHPRPRRPRRHPSSSRPATGRRRSASRSWPIGCRDHAGHRPASCCSRC